MARVREVGTLWIGGRLSWVELVCLKSFVDRGQKITLFTYHEVPNVPGGVMVRDGREVLSTDEFLKYEKNDSDALFADLFRLHMLRARAGMIWVDTDVYCHRPMDYDSDYVFGRELPNSSRLNNAVLGLPADSAVLADMLAFTGDPFAIPPFVKPALRREYAAAKAAGAPVHVSQQPWGVWGPLLLTHFVTKHRLADMAQPMDAFYPVAFPDRTRFQRRAGRVGALITPNTTALHVWASNKLELGARHAGLPPKHSYFDMLVKKHGIDPAGAPIGSRGRRQFQSGLLETLDLPPVASFADLGGGAKALALAAHARFDCDLVLIDADARGEFPEEPSLWLKPYLATLSDQGVAEDRITVVRSAEQLRPVDLLCNLEGYGDRYKVRRLEPFLKTCLHADSRLLVDLRKGSGGYPFLAAFGETETVSKRDDGGVPVARVLFRPKAPAVPVHDKGADDGWAAIARGLAGPDGFFRANATHSFLYVPRGGTLLVTFDNLDIAMTKRDDRRPWGFSFIEKQGWSMLGVMANGWTWYRDPWVGDQFDDLARSGFFAGFERVVFYGASMGGYAAAAFSGAAPGADVVAISPQSTVDRKLVPFESRYKVIWGADFSGKYGDAALVSGAARRVTILYDPFEPLDAGHADRFTAPNVMKLRASMLGHRLGSSLSQMGVLTPIILGALGGTLTEAEFYRALRARRTFPRYQRELFNRAVAAGHKVLARRLGAYILRQGDNRYIRKAMDAL